MPRALPQCCKHSGAVLETLLFQELAAGHIQHKWQQSVFALQHRRFIGVMGPAKPQTTKFDVDVAPAAHHRDIGSCRPERLVPWRQN